MGRYRRRESGMVLVIVLLLLSALTVIVMLSLVSSLTTVTSAGDERARRVATYAAESGVAEGTEYLFGVCDSATGFTAELGTTPSSAALPGNGAQPGASGSLLPASMLAWYSVSISNNFDDPSGSATVDSDETVELTALGYGPDNSSVKIKFLVHDPSCGTGGNSANYSQGNGNSSNSGTTNSGTVSNGAMTTLNAGSL
jgi:hypothetical protein